MGDYLMCQLAPIFTLNLAQIVLVPTLLIRHIGIFQLINENLESFKTRKKRYIKDMIPIKHFRYDIIFF